MKTLLFTAACLLGSAAWAIGPAHHHHEKHEHGQSRLTLVLEGGQLELSLESPAVDLLGFEHAPRNDAEQQQLAASRARLQQPGLLLQFNPEARCELTAAEVQAPWAAAQAKAEHADFTANYRFHCQQPQALNTLNLSPLFKAYPGVKRVQLEYALPGRQGKARLTARQPSARLGR